MIEKQINSFNDFLGYLNDNKKSNSWLYRGQSNTAWKLIPKIGREPYKDIDDYKAIKAWKRRASIFINRNYESWWDWITIAQHHGVPTRLLDWTFTPLVAAFFAAIDDKEKDGAIFTYKYEMFVKPETVDPFEIKKTIVYRPTSITERVINQNSIFTIHPKPFDPLESSSTKTTLQKWIIKADTKSDFLHELNLLGVNYSTIFPDLNGLAKHICWFYENIEYWTDDRNDDVSI
jgi:hypothetical protein